MKVLDMYGCGLPVLAVGFQCLPELLTHGTNGLVFATSAELAEQLTQLAAPTAEAAEARRVLRDGVARTEASRPRWAENWAASAAPLLLRGEGVGTQPSRGWGLACAALVLAVVVALLAAAAMAWMW
jgi:beta-1,4-mannosyltransferase